MRVDFFFMKEKEPKRKRVDIIGAGIAGLCVGVYLQKSGFETTIYEKHSSAGGLCTGWKRGDYTFNGCLHWLLGSRKGISFNTFWKEIIDLEELDFQYFEERSQIEIDGEIFHLYNDIDTFETYLLKLAPEDKIWIARWCDSVRKIVPLLDYLPPVRTNLMVGLKLLPMLPFMKYWAKYSNRQYAEKFHNPLLRKALQNIYDNEVRMSVLLFAQAYMAKKVAGYPLGGSKNFAEKLANRYTKLGGRLQLSSPVESVIVRDRRACGLQLKDTTTEADFVVSTADWNWTVFTALDGKFINRKLAELRHPKKEQIFYSFLMLHLGINAELHNLPHFSRFPIDELTTPDGSKYSTLEMHIYNYDPHLAPRGKVTASVNLTTREGQFWIDLRRNDYEKYLSAKKQLKEEIFARLRTKFGTEFVEKIEIAELATPATYHRYTANYLGSSQGWTPMNDITKRLPVRNTLSGLKNFFMAGHWMEAGGGVPVALISARKVAMRINKLAKL